MVNSVTRSNFNMVQIQKMQETRKPGVIINVASASGLYPLYTDPIYSGSKGLLFFASRYTWYFIAFPRYIYDLINLSILSILFRAHFSVIFGPVNDKKFRRRSDPIHQITCSLQAPRDPNQCTLPWGELCFSLFCLAFKFFSTEGKPRTHFCCWHVLISYNGN